MVALDADVARVTKTCDLEKVFPDRFFNCGVQEQNKMCVAARMALEGWLTFAKSVLATGGILAASAFAQPQPGDLFREYRWTNVGGDAGGSLRVGGRVGYGGGPIQLPHRFDLEHATKAEVVIEKLLCHEATRGFAISLNNQAWLPVPEAVDLPEPPWDYQHHTYPVVAVPLEHLKAANPPQFRMRVSDEHPWNWPQHLIYGVHVRVYYDADRKPHPAGRVVSPPPNAALGREVLLEAEAGSPHGAIRQVVFLGHHEDVNWEGDGRYTQWHYHYVQAKLTGQLATATSAPWKATWDTAWVPDQPAPFKVAAWITDATGLTLFTKPVGGLSLRRDGLSVELCKPYDVPAKWVTRAGEKSQKFRITGNLDHAVAAQLAWVSWSPGYMHGLSIDGQEVFDREGPRYAYYAHRVPLEDLGVLHPGENILTTALTPKYDGKMVHGMEVNWPGIMVLIQYQTPSVSAAAGARQHLRISPNDAIVEPRSVTLIPEARDHSAGGLECFQIITPTEAGLSQSERGK